MAAVLGLDDDVVVSVCERASAEAGICVPANFNSPGQIVISGDMAGVECAMELASEEGARRVVQLSVSGAFHSPLMTPAEDGLRQHLEKTEFRDPTYPVVANVTAEPVTSADGARDLLIRQLTSPVRWSASVGRMVESGVDEFLELGPGSVLRGLNRRNAKGTSCCSLGEPQDLDNWEGREG
jgi:[acyl-carrier-protein] S-malonyltransferase